MIYDELDETLKSKIRFKKALEDDISTSLEKVKALMRQLIIQEDTIMRLTEKMELIKEADEDEDEDN